MCFPLKKIACVVLPCIALLGAYPQFALSHDEHTSPESDLGKTRATGFVFEDLNGDRKRGKNEPGIPGIRVSNGRDIAKTDSDGRYELSVTDDTILFVLKPRDWQLPLNKKNLPQFFYIHKPNGSPKNSRFPGVAPTGPLPKSVDFAMTRHEEPEHFKAILFGDPQPRDIKEVEYITHDVVEQVIAREAHDASFGVTLGDIVFDDLDMFDPLTRAIALIDIPWYNVIGNHDLNLDAPTDALSDETFENHFGPSYYSFDYGPTHFLVLDDVVWEGPKDGQRGHYHAGLGDKQMEFIRNDLAAIPQNQLVVLLMHIPLGGVEDRQELYRLIEKRPATVSISAHTHYMEHRFIGKEDGWMGPEKHHHIVNVTVCGSWWRGQPDERGIPHATMSDGGPNGYSIMSFDGSDYSLEVIPAGRPADYQMNIYAPEVIRASESPQTVVMANVFNASEEWVCKMRLTNAAGPGDWERMSQLTTNDPAFVEEKTREEALTDKPWSSLPSPHPTPHIYRHMLPPGMSVGTYRIEVKAINKVDGLKYTGSRLIRVEK